jgi:hypothetical protein
MLVCDRCGAEKGTCFHSQYEDYAIETKEEYNSRAQLYRSILKTVLSVIILLTCFTFCK